MFAFVQSKKPVRVQDAGPPPSSPFQLFQALLPVGWREGEDQQAWKVQKSESSALFEQLSESCCSAIARQTAAGVGSHNLTYGEVAPSSIDEHVTRALDIREGDVFYDLGSGTGKIPFQVALCTGAKAVGIEFAKDRHVLAEQALRRIGECYGGVGGSAGTGSGQQKAPLQQADALVVASALQRTRIVHGDFLTADLDDATVVFINNTVFEPALMLALNAKLATLPRLRKLVVLRTLCKRHNSRCISKGEPCSVFDHPPIEATCKPTWCEQTTLFTYERPHGAAASHLTSAGPSSSASSSSRQDMFMPPPTPARPRAGSATPSRVVPTGPASAMIRRLQSDSDSDSDSGEGDSAAASGAAAGSPSRAACSSSRFAPAAMMSTPGRPQKASLGEAAGADTFATPQRAGTKRSLSSLQTTEKQKVTDSPYYVHRRTPKHPESIRQKTRLFPASPGPGVVSGTGGSPLFRQAMDDAAAASWGLDAGQ